MAQMMQDVIEQKVLHMKNLQHLTNERELLNRNYAELIDNNSKLKAELDINVAKYQQLQEEFDTTSLKFDEDFDQSTSEEETEQKLLEHDQLTEKLANQMVPLLRKIEEDRQRFMDQREQLNVIKARLAKLEAEITEERAALAETTGTLVSMQQSMSESEVQINEFKRQLKETEESQSKERESQSTLHIDLEETNHDSGSEEATLLKAALAKGKKAWGRSKIMIVGEGRAGKTALSNSIMGQAFSDTSSTIGINQLTCDIKFAKVVSTDGSSDTDSAWSEYVKPARELEAALAIMMVKDKDNNKLSESKQVISSGNAAKTMFDEEEIGVEVGDEEKDNAGYQSQYATKPDAVDDHIGHNSNESDQALNEVMFTADDSELVQSEVAMHMDTALLSTSCSEPIPGPDTLRVAPVPTIDNELVMKCLASNLQMQAESKFILSLFDFGGQSVFNVIHPFFLTRYGVYLIVFNMQWLLPAGSSSAMLETDKERPCNECLAYLTFWINSVIIHTLNDKGQTAPIIFVGTRGDIINEPHQHEVISTLLYQTFCTSMAWPYVLENEKTIGGNGTTDLYFFPVDNKLGRADRNLTRMLHVIEDRIDASDYVHEEKPLMWLQLLDQLTAKAESGHSFLSFDEVLLLAKQCTGTASPNSSNIEQSLINNVSLSSVLHFFHQMGILMWHDEESIRDVVILNPIEYFVTPATLVICKHSPTSTDNTYHSLKVHKHCQKMHNQDWQKMIKQGIVTETLFDAILLYTENDQKGIQVQQKELVKLLMIKYGLLVPLISGAGNVCEEGESNVNMSVSYLAPALLPEQNILSSSEAEHTSWYDPAVGSHCFFFVFTAASKQLETETTLTISDLRTHGFLPSGLFERLICKAVSWSQQTTSGGLETSSFGSMEVFHLTKQQAVLCYGNQRFRMTAHNDLNAIQVEVEGASPVAIHARLQGQLEKIIKECMKSLRFLTVLPFEFSSSPTSDSEVDGSTLGVSLSPSALYQPSFAQSVLFIRLRLLLHAGKQQSSLNLLTGRIQGQGRRALLRSNELHIKYGSWLEHDKILPSYDLFLSYRWGNRDSSFTQALFDRLTLYTIDTNHRAIGTFLDIHRLKEGKAFQNEFAKALSASLIAVPIISTEALIGRMIDHDPKKEDNLLAEWILMTICYQIQQQKSSSSSCKNWGTSRIRKVIPILCGRYHDHMPTTRNNIQSPIGNFFDERIVDQLPEVHPEATIELVYRIIHDTKLIPMELIPWETTWKTTTVRQIVNGMSKFLCLTPWEYGNDLSRIIAKCGEHLIRNLIECINEEATEKDREKKVMEKDKPAFSTDAIANSTSVGSATASLGKGSNMSVKELIDRIKSEFGIEKQKFNEVLEEASENFSMEVKANMQTLPTMKDKALYIAQQTGIV